MMNFLKRLMMVCALSFYGISSTNAALEMNITKGNLEPIPIAIPELQGDSDLAREITDVIINDLRSCGLFRLIDQSAFIQTPEQLKEKVSFSEWRLVKADNLVVAKAETSVSGELRVEFRLYDTVREVQIEGQAYTGDRDNWRRMAHKLADAIYKRLVGDEGYFDTQIVYISRIQEGRKRIERLAVVDQDGENHRYLTEGHSLVLTPRFSPDLRHVAFLDFVQNQPRVYLLNRDSGKKSVVGNFPGMTYAPRFSPDGSSLIMSFARGSSSLFEMNLKTTKIKRLTYDRVIDTSPCYSPDGKKIVFTSDRTGQTHLYVMNAKGGNATRISYGRGSYRTPVWSPRGDIIAFTKIFKGEFYIGVMRADGSGERLITKGFLVEGPSWSPNGRVILFTRSDRGSQAKLHMIDVTGYNEREVPTPSGAAALQGCWSNKR